MTKFSIALFGVVLIFLSILPLAYSECEVTISGTVFYYGEKTGPIFVGIVDASTETEIAWTTLSEPGPYTITFTQDPSTQGNMYLLVAQMDLDNSGGVSWDSFLNRREPSAMYRSGCEEWKKPIQINCSSFEDKNIYLPNDKVTNANGILLNSFSANYFSGNGMDMDFHDGYLWICDSTEDNNRVTDIVKIDPGNGEIVQSMDLGIKHVTSLEWIDEDLWICHKGSTAWELKQYTYIGNEFILKSTCSLPYSIDVDNVWSINIAWDGSLLWAQEKGPCANIYKIDLATCEVVETISEELFWQNNFFGLANISGICFSGETLWAMDDDFPRFIANDATNLINSEKVFYPINTDQYPIDDNARFVGMAKDENIFYFLQVIEGYYTLHAATFEDFNDVAITASQFGKTDCPICEADINEDGDVDGNDLFFVALRAPKL